MSFPTRRIKTVLNSRWGEGKGMENSSGMMLDCMSFEHLLQVQKGGSFDSVVSPTSLGHHTVLHWTLREGSVTQETHQLCRNVFAYS